MSPAGELPEMVSMGGESLGSFSEDFETVSFAEESGLYCIILGRKHMSQVCALSYWVGNI